MKRVVWLGLLSGIAVLVLALSGGAAADEKKGGGVAPLSLEGLMDEKLPEASAGTKVEEGFAANQACYVCHENYKKEPLARIHAVGEIGCVNCHGESVDHRNDENNIIPPDKMFPRADVDFMCKDCHERPHQAEPRDVIKRWQKRCAGIKVDEVNCTDCHFEHRLDSRTVEWDKKTGKLVTTSGGKVNEN